MQPLNRHLAGLIAEYDTGYITGSVLEELAEELLNESLKTKEAEAKMRRTYAEKLSKVLPPT